LEVKISLIESDLKKSEKKKGGKRPTQNNTPRRTKSVQLRSDSCGARRLRGYAYRAPETAREAVTVLYKFVQR